jgi:hypothetical protein
MPRSSRWLSAVTLIGCASNGPSDRVSHPAPADPPDDSMTAAEMVAQLESNGSIPLLDRTKTLAGIDANGDGIRDDVGRYIDEHHPMLHGAARQLAAALQASLLVDVGDATALGDVALQVSRAVDCLDRSTLKIENLPEPEVLAELQAITTNTKIRLLAYLQFNAALDGTLSFPLEGEVCD